MKYYYLEIESGIITATIIKQLRSVLKHGLPSKSQKYRKWDQINTKRINTLRYDSGGAIELKISFSTMFNRDL